MLTIVSDMLLTDSFLIKGNVENKYTRLSKLLDEHRKFFLRIRDVTLIDIRSGRSDRSSGGRVCAPSRVRAADTLLAGS